MIISQLSSIEIDFDDEVHALISSSLLPASLNTTVITINNSSESTSLILMGFAI